MGDVEELPDIHVLGPRLPNIYYAEFLPLLIPHYSAMRIFFSIGGAEHEMRGRPLISRHTLSMQQTIAPRKRRVIRRAWWHETDMKGISARDQS